MQRNTGLCGHGGEQLAGIAAKLLALLKIQWRQLFRIGSDPGGVCR
jgi:hypothetical protein